MYQVKGMYLSIPWPATVSLTLSKGGLNPWLRSEWISNVATDHRRESTDCAETEEHSKELEIRGNIRVLFFVEPASIHAKCSTSFP